MERVWLSQYPAGVPHEINPNQYQSLAHFFLENCKKFSDKKALQNLGVVFTYRQFEQSTRDFAAFLQHLGLKKGDRLAIMMPNLIQYMIVMFAALRCGIVVVNVNPLYTTDELTHQINDAQATSIVVLANFVKTVEKTLPNTKLKNIIVTELGDLLPAPKRWLFNFVVKYIKRMVPLNHIDNLISFRDAMTRGAQLPFQQIDLYGDDIAFLQYTGGTTGVAKGAVLTHRNLISNAEQANAWVNAIPDIGENEIIITALPLYHIFSLTANALTFLKRGALNVLITNPRDLNRFINEMTKVQFTAFTGVNTLFNALLNHPKFSQIDFSKLHLTLGGGMAVQSEVARRWFETTGCVLTQAYGLTETSPAVTINPFVGREFTGAIGLPLPSTEVSIRDEEGNELSFDEAGELYVRGPQVMRGYWNKPTETANVLSLDGWLRTGDIATIDRQGYVRIVDRIKDMIVISGFKVFPNEVEDVIAKLPGVSEVGVVGKPNGNGREIVKAFIVKKEEGLTQDQVINFCREHLTAYKVPREVTFINELPKTNVGKILRRGLRDL